MNNNMMEKEERASSKRFQERLRRWWI